MNHIAFKSVLLGTLIALSSCASLSPPERPAYTGVDQVDAVQPAQLVGIWTVRDLNPYPDAHPQSTTIEYRADGSVLGLLIPRGEAVEALGDMEFELNASWSLEGDTVIHEDLTIQSTSDNAMAGIMANMMNSREGLAGRANIYELTADRIVMVGSDGAAMEYLRQ